MRKRILIFVALIFTVLLTSCKEKPSLEMHTITFYNEENVYFTIKTIGNEYLTYPITPTKENYTFDAWYLKNDVKFDISIYVDKSLDENINVYAKFIVTQPS